MTEYFRSESERELSDVARDELEQSYRTDLSRFALNLTDKGGLVAGVYAVMQDPIDWKVGLLGVALVVISEVYGKRERALQMVRMAAEVESRIRDYINQENHQ